MSSVPQSAARSPSDIIEEAERLWKAGAVQAAFEAYRIAVAALLNSSKPATAADIVALERFADRAVALGRYEAATEALSAMADLCTAAGNAYGEDYAALKAVLALHQAGDLRRALSLLYSLTQRFGNIDAIEFTPEALSEWEPTVRWPETDLDDRAVMFALFYLAGSRLMSSLGQYGDATEAARRGAVHAARNTPLARRYRIPLALAEALAAVQSGALDRASTLLQEAQEEIDSKRDPGFHFEALELSAKVAMLRGDLGAALEGLSKAVEAARQWPDRRVQAICLENLASFQILINQTANAKTVLDEAASLLGDVQDGRIAQLRAMADLRASSYSDDFSRPVSAVWEGSGEVEQASSTPAPARGPVSQPADFLAWFEQRTVEIQLALANGRMDLAAEMLAAIHESFGATDSELVHLRIAFLDALLAYYRGEFGPANETLGALLPRLEQNGLLHDLWQARRLAAWIAKRSRASAAMEATRIKESRTLSILASSLDPVSRAIFLLNKWRDQEEQIAGLAEIAVAYQNQPRSRFAPLRWWRKFQSWRKTLDVENRFESEKRTLAAVSRGPSTAAARAVNPFDVLWHPTREAVVTFSALPDRLVAILRTRRIARIHVLPVSRIDLRAAVKAWHERMLQPGSVARKQTDWLSSALAVVMAELPAGVDELNVQPDDALHGYPFAALKVNGAFAIEKYRISLGNPRGARAKGAGSRDAVVLPVTESLGGYPALPNAAGEAEAVSAVLSSLGFKVRGTAGQSARKREAAEALANAAVVHIACHGRFQPDQPSETGLLFAGADGRPETLSVTDIRTADCSKLEHVTLSACWSADNFVVPGRWIFSLPDTLCRAGARSVLASLWEADDRIARAFMGRFYTNLATMTRSEAVRDAQLACLRNQLCSGIDTSDSLNWASFYLFGENGALRCN